LRAAIPPGRVRDMEQRIKPNRRPLDEIVDDVVWTLGDASYNELILSEAETPREGASDP
jgi:hypothetical protein